MPRAVDNYKTCTRCTLTKSVSEFSKKSSNIDGYDCWCKECVKAYNHQNKDKRAVSQKEKRKKSKGIFNIYCIRSRLKKLGLPIPDKYRLSEKPLKTQKQILEEKRIKSRTYKAEHRNEIREKSKEYNHSEKGRLAKIRGFHKRRSLEMSVENTFNDNDFFLLLEFQGYKCACCGLEFSKDNIPCRDHIKPLSKGGSFELSNIQLLCRSCNSKKHDKYILYRELLPDEVIAGGI